MPPINLEVAKQARANREKAMPEEWGTAYGATWLVVEEANGIVGRLNKPVFDLDKEEAEVVFLMLFNSLSDIISAVYTLTSGWIRPSKTSVRGALETIATAVTIHHDTAKMQKFIEKGLKIPQDVLASAAEHLPDIKRLYGTLSNQWAHETFDSTARSIHDEAGQLLLVPYPTAKTMPMYINAFVEVAVLAQIVGIALETCFPNLAGPDVHFRLEADGSRTRLASKSTDALQAIVEARELFKRASGSR